MSFCLALRVGDSGNVVRDKTDKKHKHDAEYVAARFLLDWDGIPSGLQVGLEDFPCDRSVEDDQQKKHSPEDAHKDVVGCFVPLESQFIFQLHTFYMRPLPVCGILVGQDDVGDGQEEHEHPDHHWQEFAVIRWMDERRGKRLDNFIVPVKTDEPEEHDADVHVDVEEHSRHPAHEHVDLPRPEPRIRQNLEGEGQAHQKVGNDNVLKVDDETLGAGHVEEYPSRDAVEQGSRDEDHEVQHRDDLLSDEDVPGAGLLWRLCGGGIDHFVTSGGEAWEATSRFHSKGT